MTRRVALALSTLLLLVPILAASSAAIAQAPGKNGRIAFREDGDLRWVMPDGRRERLLVDASTASYPNFVPSGKAVVYSDDPVDDDDIYRYTLGAAMPVQLTDNSTDDWGAFQGPDQITYVCEPNGDSDICVMNKDGLGVLNLTNTPTFDEWNPKFSPNGNRIVYSSNDGGDREIWSMRANGTDKDQLTVNTVGDSEPEYSPTGKRIVLVDTTNDDLVVMDADGTHEVVLDEMPLPATNQPRTPSWSPDGTKIAFGLNVAGSVAVVKPNGADYQIVRADAGDNISWQRKP